MKLHLAACCHAFTDRRVGIAGVGRTGCPEIAAILFDPRILLILLVLLTAACSRTQFFYDKADWLAYRWTVNLVDASKAQKQAWRDLFRRAMAQHRRELLPPLVGLLDELEAILRLDPSEAALTCWGAAADRVYEDHVRWAAPTATAVLSDLAPQQIEHLATELEERNQEYAEDYLESNPKRRHQARVKRYVKRIERWTGDLSDDQITLVEQSLQGFPDIAGDWLAYRRDRQARLLERLRSATEPQALQGFITDWWVRFGGRAPALVRDSERLRVGTLQMVAALEPELTEQQRAELLDNLTQLRTELAAASGMAVAQGMDSTCTDPA